MEKLVDFYKNKRIIVTGHTGLKGTWLSLALNQLGAKVIGISNSELIHKSHLCTINPKLRGYIENIENEDLLIEILKKENPDLIFHLAAQSIVGEANSNPLPNWITNVKGTLNVINASQYLESLNGIVIATTDKVYDRGRDLEFKTEFSKLAGSENYSWSKVVVEDIISSLRKNSPKLILPTVRCGNVIGGGDWSNQRLFSDIGRAMLSGSNIKIRNSQSIRPWIHVLDAVYGYLLIGGEVLKQNRIVDTAWNISPSQEDHFSVENICYYLSSIDKELFFDLKMSSNSMEVPYLLIDSTKFRNYFDWKPKFSCQESVKLTYLWYKEFKNGKIVTMQQLQKYWNL